MFFVDKVWAIGYNFPYLIYSRRMKVKNGKPDSLPFSVSRASRTTLVAQVVEGVRKCITSGFFREGDVLPTTRDLAAMLGVSRIVTRAAVKALTDDGLIIPRPRAGCVVLGRGEKLWRGNVLFVSRTDGRGYYESVFIAALRKRLVKAGWLFTQVNALPEADGKTDVSELEMHLNSPVSLAVSIFGNSDAELVLSRSGIPFMTLDHKPECGLNGCVGHVRYDSTEAAGKLAKAAVRAGAKTVMQVGFSPFDDVYAALETSGMKVSRWNIQLPKGGKKPETAAFAAHEAFATRLSKSWTWFPDLNYFSDDYACVGALAAFAEAGVKVPVDVRIATWSNAGNNPVFAKELTRTEMDPEADAAKLATALLAHLEGHPVAFPQIFGPTFRKGATL